MNFNWRRETKDSRMDDECDSIVGIEREVFTLSALSTPPVDPISSSMEPRRNRRLSKVFLCIAAFAMMGAAGTGQKSKHQNQLLPDNTPFPVSREQVRRNRNLQNETDTGNMESYFGLENENSTNATFLAQTDRSEPLNNTNNNQTIPPSDELPVIEITLPAGVTTSDENVADVIAEQIDETTNAETEAPTRAPTKSPTRSPINDSLVSASPTVSPTISFQPTLAPTTSPQPTISMAPTDSPAPSSPPTISPTESPSLHPTETFLPSASPSTSPTTSPQPSSLPSSVPSVSPTISQAPSSNPTISLQPTLSIAPSASPSNSPTAAPSPGPTPVATEVAIKRNNVMVLSNVPFALHNGTLGVWEEVTSQHIINYFQKFSRTYTNEFFFEIVDVETEFISQKIVEGEATAKNGKASTVTAPRKDQPMERPPYTPVELPNTLTIEIAYNQWVVYETDEVDMSEDELYNRLFVLPFTTDSFHYSMDLYNSELNWTTWIFVDTVDPIPPPTAPPAPPTRVASGLTSAQTFAIAASTIVAACLIVFALLKERNQKGRGDESISGDSPMHAMRGNSFRDGEAPWNNNTVYHHRNEDGSGVTVEDAAYDSVRSSRTTSGHRQNAVERGTHRPKEHAFVDERRGRDNGKFGTYRSISSTNSSNPDNNKHGLSPRYSPRNDVYGSPGIPRHVSGSSAANNRSSMIRNDKGDRPYFPPLPPSSSYGSGLTPERPRPMMEPLESGHAKDFSNSNMNNMGAMNRFGRPSGRAFGMRLSGIVNDDMTEISILTDPFSSDHRRQSNDFVIPNPQFESK